MSSNTVLWGRSRNDLIKLAITVLLPLFIFLVPTNDVFTADFRLFLVITLIAIISFATDSLPQTGVAIALPVAYVVLGIAPGDVVFSAWLNYVPWMMIGALILSLVLEKTQLMKRIAYHCILLTGASYKGIVMGLILAGVIMNLFIMDNSIIPMAALAYGVCPRDESETGAGFCRDHAGCCVQRADADELALQLQPGDPHRAGTVFRRSCEHRLVRSYPASAANGALYCWAWCALSGAVPS